MKPDALRADLLIGVTLLSAALVLAFVTGWPAYLFSPFMLAGVVLAGEAGYTAHTFQKCARFERTMQVQAKVKPVTITQGVPTAVRNMVYGWHQGKDTTKRHALALGVTEEQWRQAVRWAVDNRLGELVPAEGGSRKLRWLSGSLNDVLPALDQLALLA